MQLFRLVCVGERGPVQGNGPGGEGEGLSFHLLDPRARQSGSVRHSDSGVASLPSCVCCTQPRGVG